MVVERHRRDLRTRTRHSRNLNCHYQGHVRGDYRSKVALSACDGLVSNFCTLFFDAMIFAYNQLQKMN